MNRWAAETRILLRTGGLAGRTVAVRLGFRRRLLLDVTGDGDAADPHALRITVAPLGGRASALPVLPDAATWVLPDLALLRAGLIGADRLHPLVASALVPGHQHALPWQPGSTAGPRVVECGGGQHRIGVVNGTLVALDHDPTEIRREELLAALTGTPVPCLQVIDEAHRHPECLADVRARLDHGDMAGALAAVEGLLGPDALLRDGALRDALERAASRRIVHGMFRAGLARQPGPATGSANGPGVLRRDRRAHPRHAMAR